MLRRRLSNLAETLAPLTDSSRGLMLRTPAPSGLVKILLVVLFLIITYQHYEIQSLRQASSSWPLDLGLDEVDSSSSQSEPSPLPVDDSLPEEPSEEPSPLAEGASASSVDTSLAASGSVITILTGTHSTRVMAQVDESKQPPLCVKLADSLHDMWAAWEVKPYLRAKTQVKALLKQIRLEHVSCTLAGSRKHNMLWTFPLSWRPDGECDAKTKTTLERKTYLRDKTYVYVNWFLLRPDLVTFNNMALVEGLTPRFAVTVGHDPRSAAFAREGCPRLNTILEKREVYKQRLLLLMLSDVEHQLGRMRGNAARVYVCTRQQLPERLRGPALEALAEWLPVPVQPKEMGCEARPSLAESRTHMGSMVMMRLFGGAEARLAKTVFTGPRLVFVAGLEGVGHHVFSLLGRKHTTRGLYEALTDHLCDSAWDDNSEAKYGPARQRLVSAMRQVREDPSIRPKDGSGLFFLNTIWVQRDVNMYSLPWGGPRCFLKRYARGMCNVDIVELARMAEEAQVDFRIVFLKRAIGAAVVSASLHRPFGTVVSETRMLAQSWALLKSALDTIDARFVLEIGYEDLMNHPDESTAKLADHLGFTKESPLYAHFESSLKESAAEHPVGDGSKWKEEVDGFQMAFMSDLLD